jgi:hypothetical protein
VHTMVARFRARRARADEQPDSSVLSSDPGVTGLPPAVVRAPVAAAADADPPGGSWAGDLRLLA